MSNHGVLHRRPTPITLILAPTTWNSSGTPTSVVILLSSFLLEKGKAYASSKPRHTWRCSGWRCRRLTVTPNNERPESRRGTEEERSRPSALHCSSKCLFIMILCHLKTKYRFEKKYHCFKCQVSSRVFMRLSPTHKRG